MAILSKLVRRLIGGEHDPAPDAIKATPPPPPPPAASPKVPLSQPRPAAPAGGLQIPVRPFKRFPNLPGSDQQVLAHMGQTVCARLDRNPSAERIAALNLDMFRVRNFLSPEECAATIELVEADAKPSTVLNTRGNDSIRTSQTCRLPGTDPLIALIEQRMAELLGLPLSHSETVQGQRYAPGQQFKMHNDYFAGGQPYSATVASEGGQRTWTAMVFLNTPAAGGCTNFPRAGVKVAPEAGALLTWNNNDREGLSNPFSHHEGMVVEAGIKYILTKWFREREWHSSAASDALRA
jgi:prolyl 4-hydroxylase